MMILAVALVASVGLALLVHGMFSKPAAPPPAVVAAAVPMTRVLVAKTDLGVGDHLSADNMSWQSWPSSNVSPLFVTDGETAAAPKAGAESAVATAKTTVTDIATGGGPKMQAMIGAVVREPIVQGEPLTANKIIHAGDTSYMAVRLPEGMRAIALPLTLESGAGGFIQPGDHVDVLSTHTDQSKGNSGGGMVTDQVLANALVLAIDQHTDSPKTGAPVGGATITIEVPEGSATAVAKARTQGGLTLALRSYTDIAGRASGRGLDDAHGVKIFRGGASAEMVSAQ
jgi:pilus assembly protein CpaB